MGLGAGERLRELLAEREARRFLVVGACGDWERLTDRLVGEVWGERRDGEVRGDRDRLDSAADGEGTFASSAALLTFSSGSCFTSCLIYRKEGEGHPCHGNWTNT